METNRNRVKRIGGRCFDVALGVFLIAVLAMVWNSSRAKANSTTEDGSILISPTGATGINAVAALQGTICIVDDGSQRQIQFDSTGTYMFTDCAGTTVSGIGVFTMKGSTITLRDVKTDRRLDLTMYNPPGRATMSLQLLTSPGRLFTITDRNTNGDVCGCTCK